MVSQEPHLLPNFEDQHTGDSGEDLETVLRSLAAVLNLQDKISAGRYSWLN